MKRTTLVLAAVALLLGGAKQAESSVITAIPGGTVVPFPRIGYQGPGPESFGPGITWSSTNATHHQGGSLFGYVGDYGFSGNGFWLPYDMAGLNDSTAEDGSTDTMTFAFSTSVAAVGGFLNYVPGSSNPTTIAVYDSDHDLIESYNLTFLTGGLANSGDFLGFKESTPDIGYFTLTDNYVAITNLTFSAVPEPSSLALLGVGIAGMAGFGWPRRNLASA